MVIGRWRKEKCIGINNDANNKTQNNAFERLFWYKRAWT
jgi:hypothetical protein